MTDTEKKSLRIGILEAGQNIPELVPEYGGFGDWFGPFLDKSGRNIDYHIYRVFDGEMPEAANESDAWLVTGSEVSTYNDVHWQAPLISFLRAAADSCPIIGICYGHQLLHHAFGGKVAKSDKGWGIGIQTYRVAQSPEWIRPSQKEFSLLISHQDQVETPAPNSVTLGGSDFCPIGMSLIGDNILTMQPHPELNLKLAETVFRMRRDVQGGEVTDTALETLKHRIDDKLAADWILSFIEIRGAQARKE